MHVLAALVLCVCSVSVYGGGGNNDEWIFATAEIEPNPSYAGSNVSGVVIFRQKIKGGKMTPTEYMVNLMGFGNQDVGVLHGNHIHTFGTIRDGCEAAEGHYNPTGRKHGLATAKRRHVGDLMNVQEDDEGNCVAFIQTTNKKLNLRGKNNIIGRSWDVHELADDGKPPNGNSGRSLACGVIAISNGDGWM